MDLVFEESVEKIQRKLCNGEQLEPHEIIWIISALRKANELPQKPYYEVVYHDEYDRQERRIMEPVATNCGRQGDFLIKRDKFELHFQRIVPYVREGEKNEQT